MQGVSFLCISLEVLKTTTTTNTNIYHPNMASVLWAKSKEIVVIEPCSNADMTLMSVIGNGSFTSRGAACHTDAGRENQNVLNIKGKPSHLALPTGSR
jgi:hypothetical protein